MPPSARKNKRDRYVPDASHCSTGNRNNQYGCTGTAHRHDRNRVGPTGPAAGATGEAFHLRQRLGSVHGREMGDGRTVDGYFFFNDTGSTELYTLSLRDALPI